MQKQQLKLQEELTMENYPLHRNKNIKTLLTPTNSMYSDEYADRMCSLHLHRELHKNEEGKLLNYYRLRAKDSHSIEDALAYDIHCPKCTNGMLKQISRCTNTRELGLYTCPSCNKEKYIGGSIYE